MGDSSQMSFCSEMSGASRIPAQLHTERAREDNWLTPDELSMIVVKIDGIPDLKANEDVTQH